MRFIYLYDHGDLSSDLWKSDLYFTPAEQKEICIKSTRVNRIHKLTCVLSESLIF